MTMLTRCSACDTVFRIATDQLVSRQGKVRCGRCGEIFDALDMLVQHPGETAPDNAAPETIAENNSDASAYDLFSAPAEPAIEIGADAPVESMPEAKAETDAIEAPLANLSPFSLPQVSFLASDTGTRRRFPWLSLAGVLLALTTLVGQGAWFYRNDLATQYPPLKPLLETACKQIGCRLEATIDPQAISIESSDLQADPDNRAVLILSAVLRNRASFEQNLPLLELALTDAQDMALARRVLKPQEYSQALTTATIGAGSELQVRLLLDASRIKAHGYRLYAFYP